jgi:hypothetical protein
VNLTGAFFKQTVLSTRKGRCKNGTPQLRQASPPSVGRLVVRIDVWDGAGDNVVEHLAGRVVVKNWQE